jgi:prevent-host-death family protein
VDASLTSQSSITREAVMRWQLQEAKAKLSELVKRAESEGPQEITVHGEPKAVVLSKAEFDSLTKAKAQPSNFVEFVRQSPLYGLDIPIERDEVPERGTPIDYERMFGDVDDESSR